MVSYLEMSKRKWMLGLAGILLVFWALRSTPEPLIGVAVAHAQSIPNNPLSQVLSMMFGIVNIACVMLYAGLWVIVWILDILMRPEIVFDLRNGTSGEFMTLLHDMWMFSRDIVNLAFVFILIGGAIYTVVKANMELVKKMAPTFVLALVLVNFSWFIPQVIFDVSNVLTFTVYQIPSMFGTDDCRVKLADGTTEECKIPVDFKFFEQTRGLTSGDGSWNCLKDIVCFQSEPYSSAKTNADVPKSILLLGGLVVNFAHLKDFANPNVMTATPPGLAGAIMLLVKMILIVLVHIALFFPLLAMAFAFAARIPIIWLTVAFMPFVALGYVLQGKMGEFDPVDKIMKSFLTSVFLPAMVAVPFAIGFVMIRQGMNVDPGAFNLPADKMNAIALPLFANIGSPWDMLWMALSIGVMWVGVFAILKRQQITSSITESIKGVGQSLGKTALQVPLSVPLPFMPKGQTALGGYRQMKSMQQVLSDTGNLNKAFQAGNNNSGAADQADHLKSLVDKLDDTKRGNIQMKINTKIDAVAAANPADRNSRIEELVREVKNNFQDDKRVQDMNNEPVLRGLGKAFPLLKDKLDKAIEEKPAAPSTPAPPPPPPGGPTTP